MCTVNIPEEHMQTVFLPKNKQMTINRVCGRCFVLVSILDSLRRMESGRPIKPGLQKPIGNDEGRGN